MTLSRADLSELAGKYAEMLRLRQADAAAPDPRAAMARLATEFPGVLRELDDFPLDVIEARRAALERVDRTAATNEAGRAATLAQVEPWMVACATFHHFARGALSAKRWLDGKKVVDAATAAAFVEAANALPFPRDALIWAGDLASLANPPRGRLSQLVFERVGHAMGISAKEVRVLVFGPSRRERRARAEGPLAP